MSIKLISAIINEIQIEPVKKALESHGVTGFSIHSVKGRGRNCCTFSSNHLISYSQIEIYTSEQHVDKIARLIMHTADVGAGNEGLIAITSVDQLFWIHNQTIANTDEFNFLENVD